jgi:hypothetical protein
MRSCAEMARPSSPTTSLNVKYAGGRNDRQMCDLKNLKGMSTRTTGSTGSHLGPGRNRPGAGGTSRGRFENPDACSRPNATPSVDNSGDPPIGVQLGARKRSG